MSCGGLSVVAGCNRGPRSEPSNGNTTGTDSTPELAAETDATFELREQTIPDQTTVGESVEIELVFENTGTEAGRYRNTLIARPEGPVAAEYQIDVTAAANEMVTWHSGPTEFAHPGYVDYDLPGTDGFEPHRLMVAPQSKAPELLAVNLVSAWTDFDDTFENAIEDAPAGQPIEIADRHRYWHGTEGRYELFRQVEVLDSAGERVAISQRTERDTTAHEGFETWEGVAWFDAREWPPGTYTAVTVLRNEQTGERSEPMRRHFALVEASDT